MNKVILAVATIALTSSAAFADGISSRYVYGDAPSQSQQPVASQKVASGSFDYRSTASVHNPLAVSGTQTNQDNPLSYNPLSKTLRGAGAN